MADDLSNIDLVRPGSDGPNGAESGSRSPLALVAIVLVVVLIAGGAYLYTRRARPAPAAQAKPPAADSVQVRRDPVAADALPPLDETDPLVRQLVGALSSHPVVAAWLTTDRLIDNFVVSVTRVANGQTPARELKAIGPVSAFQTRTTAQKTTVIDRASYRRYDRYAQAVAAIDARGAARVYETLKPRIAEADRNFGGKESFDSVLDRAIGELLEVPVIDGDIAVKSVGVGYAFADPKLEALSSAQRQLLRMGPENVRVVQAKLREIRSALALADSTLRPPH